MEQQQELTRLKRIDWVDIRLPGWYSIGRYLLWGVGRISFSAWFFGIYTVKTSAKIIINACEMTESSTKRLLSIYDQLPHMGTPSQSVINAVVLPVTTQITDVITDIIEAIKGRQLMIIGEMGTGKSTLAQYLAYTVGGSVKVYECEGTPEDWQGLEVIGKGEDWLAIESGMRDDLEDLSSQMQLRFDKGDRALEGTEKVIICEEYPELVSKVDSSGEWLERHARRGRKARRFTILLSQYDRVSAWGLEGKSDLSEAFYRLRLGKKAVAHAKSLKSDDLVTWLQSDRSHCLLDDQPCKLPPYQEMKAVTQRLQIPAKIASAVTAEPTAQQGFQAASAPHNQPSEIQKKAIKACLDAGLSDSKIIKEILGYQGSQYQQGKELLQLLKNS
jgi:energy-coupling factor transporter ATP-binding protein EcfA2